MCIFMYNYLCFVYAFKCVVLVTHVDVVYPLLAGTRIDNVGQDIIRDSVILKLVNAFELSATSFANVPL